jgi:FkbM family methyltransferase
MLRRLVRGIRRRIAPRAYWNPVLSSLRRDSSYQVLFIASQLCDKNKTSIDVGADAGIFTANFLDKSRDCIAFEPLPRQSAILREMFERLSLPVRVEAIALSDKQGEARLRILEKDTGRSTIEAENPLEDPDGSPRYEIMVPTRPLDDYALKAVGFIKIDVEGHGLAVLRGALKTIRRCLPILLIEIENRHKPSGCKEAFDLLKRIDYDGYFVLNRQLVSVTDFDSDIHQNPNNIGGWKSGYKTSGTYVNDFFFLPAGSKPLLQAALERSLLPGQ